MQRLGNGSIKLITNADFCGGDAVVASRVNVWEIGCPAAHNSRGLQHCNPRE